MYHKGLLFSMLKFNVAHCSDVLLAAATDEGDLNPRNLLPKALMSVAVADPNKLEL